MFLAHVAPTAMSAQYTKNTLDYASQMVSVSEKKKKNVHVMHAAIPIAANFTLNGRFFNTKLSFSGAILHYLSICNRKLKKKVAIKCAIHVRSAAAFPSSRKLDAEARRRRGQQYLACSTNFEFVQLWVQPTLCLTCNLTSTYLCVVACQGAYGVREERVEVRIIRQV